ncbi:CoA transferase [Comamonas serinivorans]|uniref:CoA transferase n=1 Tax=Comamonas serinivorans TaxID=1082851 RepID=A0A1Y0EPN2_9BURK|nr:CoA transferase [Comamonas serinivorans]ARU05605.1 CoA transferase [Comamonas serinivorans]
MTQPLNGVRVIDMSHVIAGPLASMYLAQLGAEVIKIEPPDGGEVMRNSQSAGFAALNAGKRSLAVDIRQPEGAELVRQLARTADVFIENFRPGTVARHGLAYEDLRACRPDIVYASLSGYGQQGEWSGRGAYDHVIQALTGMMMMSGDDEAAPPVKVGFPVVDVAVGMLGALSITAALHRRQACGQGEHVDVSMVQAALMLMYPKVNAFLTEGEAPRRVGNRGYTGSPGADTFRCADGWLSTAANTPAQFRALTEVLDLPGLCRDDALLDLAAFEGERGFVKARDAQRLQQVLQQAFAAQSAAAMEASLNARGVPAARVRSLDGFLTEVAEGGQLALPATRYQAGDQQVRTAGLGFCYRHEPLPQQADLAALGRDTQALLHELGLDAQALAALQAAGVVR